MAIFLTDNSIICPFEIDAGLMSLSMRITSKYPVKKSKYLALLDWIEEHTAYDSTSSFWGMVSRRCRTSLEVFNFREGNCAELSFLYIVMARSSSLESGFVLVNKDNNGKEVCHACATASLDSVVLVDPAYHEFNIKHQEYKAKNDAETNIIFSRWNQKH